MRTRWFGKVLATGVAITCVSSAALGQSSAALDQTPFGAAPADRNVVKVGKNYIQSGFATCIDVDRCDIKFAKLKAGETVLFKMISCSILSERTFIGIQFEGRKKANNFGATPVFIEKPTSGLFNGRILTFINQQISLIVRGGEFPYGLIVQATQGDLSGTCTISGEILS